MMRIIDITRRTLLLTLGLGTAATTGTVQAFDFGNMMNPSRWFGGNRDRYYGDYGYGYGGPGYGYGPPGYGYGAPGYGYGAPGSGYGGVPGYGAPGYGYGAPGYGYGGAPGYGYGGVRGYGAPATGQAGAPAIPPAPYSEGDMQSAAPASGQARPSSSTRSVGKAARDTAMPPYESGTSGYGANIPGYFGAKPGTGAQPPAGSYSGPSEGTYSTPQGRRYNPPSAGGYSVPSEGTYSTPPAGSSGGGYRQ
jgi:hypothetical protein